VSEWQGSRENAENAEENAENAESAENAEKEWTLNGSRAFPAFSGVPGVYSPPG